MQNTALNAKTIKMPLIGRASHVFEFRIRQGYITFENQQFMFEQRRGYQTLDSNIGDAAASPISGHKEIGNILQLSPDRRDASGHRGMLISAQWILHKFLRMHSANLLQSYIS
jgi:hypothetical protein